MNQSDLYLKVFGENRQQESYKYIAHNFSGRICGKTYCINCGLISSSTEFSRWAVDKGCMNKIHSSYQSKRKKTRPY